MSSDGPAGSGGLAVGEIRLTGVTRAYRVIQDPTPTFKAALVRRGRARTRELIAVSDVTLAIEAGQALGIVGVNGSGKSTLLKLMGGIIPPDAGTVEVGGDVAAMLELGSGFHPDFSGRENVYMNASIHGLTRAQVDERMEDIVAFAELADFIDAPIRTYSSGMQMRLAFAVSSHVNPDVLLLDEVLAVGDEAFQRKCLGRIFEFRRAGGTLVFVSHDPAAIERVCDRAVLIESGAIVDDGAPEEIIALYHRRLAGASGRVALDSSGSGATDGALGRDDDRSWGTGEAVITAVRLLGDDGPTDRFMSGDPLTIEMEIQPNAPIPAPNFGIGIHTADGMLCYGTNTRIDALAVGTIDSPQTVRFSIPALGLHEGAFTVQVAVVSHDESVVYHWLDRWVDFTVFARDTGVGPVRISGEWSLDASGAPSGSSAEAGPQRQASGRS